MTYKENDNRLVITLKSLIDYSSSVSTVVSKKYIKETYEIFDNAFNFLEKDNFELNYNLKLIRNKFKNLL